VWRAEGATLRFLLPETFSCPPLGGSPKKENPPLRISFKKIPICIFSHLKLQDILHKFLHRVLHAHKEIFLGKICDETFALLDKSVYHIFGEDCA
jgi:hypothetical protein